MHYPYNVDVVCISKKKKLSYKMDIDLADATLIKYRKNVTELVLGKLGLAFYVTDNRQTLQGQFTNAKNLFKKGSKQNKNRK